MRKFYALLHTENVSSVKGYISQGKNAHPGMVIDCTKCTVTKTTFNGLLLPLHFEDKNSRDRKQNPHIKNPSAIYLAAFPYQVSVSRVI